MMADHGEPCGALEASYCLHGGTCFMIPTVVTPNCKCAPNYKGNRCNEMQLPSTSMDAERAGLIAAVVIVVLLILVILAVVIYYTCKVWKRKPKTTQNTEYWKVARRV
ncbi:pro-neuregulin-4, membrane-bound isoform-like [Conger conger]|nr:pro-neuregulin-4, membrane-bound isoform-like [Conger conger]